MTATTAAAARALTPAVRRVLIGLFLIVAFAATSTVLLFVITAERLQDSLNAPALTNVSVSTGWIRQDVAAIEHYWTVYHSIEKKQDDANELLYQATVRNEASRAEMVRIAAEIRDFIALNDTVYIRPPLKVHPFVERGAVEAQPTAPAPAATPAAPAPGSASAPASETPAAAPPASTNAAAPSAAAQHSRHPAPEPQQAAPPAASARAALPIELGKDVDDYLDTYYSALGPGDTDARKSLDDFKAQIYKKLAKYFSARAQYDADTSSVNSLRALIASLRSDARQLDTDVVTENTNLSNDAYWNLCEDFLAFKSLAGERAYDIVALPRMMLVLVLAIFMGILGSLIYISQDYLRNPDGRGFWDILFRIGLGAGVAFALFFFAAAGMLALAQTSSSGQTEMSPYLISFLGITGGYLSDRVTQWMREVGENAFRIKSDGPPDRWGVGIAAALAAAGLDNAALAKATGAAQADVDAWVSLSKPVPGDKQALIAAFLRVHPSKVFTDIAPG
ncbi:MAG TPA: hypothetical protein VMH86_00415 [Rhizomicrobium sp.]|nr:hypothetical protein [Rhizomicrobium sp.]